MEKMVLYTTGCPKCRILEKKMNDKNLEFEKVDDTAKMAELGIESVPALRIQDGTLLGYFDAVNYVNGQ